MHIKSQGQQSFKIGTIFPKIRRIKHEKTRSDSRAFQLATFLDNQT